MTDWDTWSRILDAAQDPQYRDAVQQFLAQAELTAEIPATLDEKFLAPRRAAGASGEECAFLLCNLGFAALASGSAEAANFAMSCGQVANSLASGVPDLDLRRHFLSAKSALQIAVLNDQPHVGWTEAATECTSYLRSIEAFLDAIPPQAIEGNAMAAYSFSGQFLVRMQRFRAVEHYADEISDLVSSAISLSTRLPSSLVSRMWARIIPGTNAEDLFRQAGALAARATNSEADQEGVARDVALSSMPVDQVVDNWCERWIDVSDDSHWTGQPGGLSVSADDREGWRLEALTAARQASLPTALEIVARHEGFLVDSITRDRAGWADRLRVSMQPKSELRRDDASAEELLDEVFEKLEPGTAILQSIVAGADVLTLVARFQGGVSNIDSVTAERTAFSLRASHKAWARACAVQDQMDGAWTGLMSELQKIWRDPIQSLLDDGVTQLVFAGDTYVGIPLHALEFDAARRLLNELLPVTFTPSLATLRDGIDRVSPNAEASNVVKLDAQLKTDAKFPFDSTLAMDGQNQSIADIVANLAFSDCEIVCGLCNDSFLPMTLRPPGFDPAGMLLAAGAGSVLESNAWVDQETTSGFVQSFLDAWKSGQQPAAACQQAVTTLRSGDLQGPDYRWGGLRLTGTPQTSG